jgi:hypothetical protein
VAALVAALALLLWIGRSASRRAETAAAPGATPAAAGASGAATPARASAEPTGSAPPTEAPTIVLPTPGPAAAADAIVGATRIVETTPAPTRARPAPRSPVPTAVPTSAALPAPAGLAAAAPASAAAQRATAPDDAPADKAYRTRRYAKFSASPDQARLYLDGRYTGIVDDWDDRGGGKTLPFGEGRHRVRLELPGYRTLHLDVLVTPEADDETVEIDDELKRLSRVDYPKLKGPAGRTEGPVIFSVVPPGAVVSENGRALGPASSFGPATPLKLAGPMVHDLEISAPGYESRNIRILVSSNADRPQAVVTLSLKALPASGN